MNTENGKQADEWVNMTYTAHTERQWPKPADGMSTPRQTHGLWRTTHNERAKSFVRRREGATKQIECASKQAKREKN